MSEEPYHSAGRVFVIVDNGSDHRGKAAVKRLRKARPNCIMIHTPVHASWLNQVEVFFSILHHDPHSGARVVAEPGGGLLFDHPAESRLPQRLRQH
jgi:hypothetical protein